MNNDYQLQEQHEEQQWKVYAKLQKARVMLQSMPIKIALWHDIVSNSPKTI